MNRNQKIGIALIALLLGALYLSHLNHKAAATEVLEKNYAEKLRLAQGFSRLKKQWGAKKRGAKLFRALQALHKADQTYNRGKKVTLLYHQLKPADFDKITQAILNSDASILTLKMQKLEKGIKLDLELAL